MSLEFDMQQHFQQLNNLSSNEEKIEQTMRIFLKLFPGSRFHFFRYSPLDHLAEGIIAVESNEITHIRTIRDDVRSLPGVFAAIRERRAKFISKQDYLKSMGSKYSYSTYSLAVVPVCMDTVAVGYILSTDFEEDTVFDDKLLSALTLFGQMAGKSLQHSIGVDKNDLLSRRELEVMHRIANGDSLYQLSESMGISETTVKQYVKSAIKKLGAQNRTQAVAELFRKGIIA